MTNRNAYTINIPNVVDGKNITELGPGLLSGINFVNSDSENEEMIFLETNMRIRKVNVPEGIEVIYELREDFVLGSFVYDLNLSEISFPSTLTTIGNYSFYSTSLTNVTIPASVEIIGAAAFSDNNITNLTIPKSVTTIGNGAFSGNPLSSLTFAGASTNGSGNDTSALTKIESKAFYADGIDIIIYLPSSLTTLEQYSFGCDYRDSLCTFYINQTTIPETIDSLWAGNYARKYILNGSGGYTCVENCP